MIPSDSPVINVWVQACCQIRSAHASHRGHFNESGLILTLVTRFADGDGLTRQLPATSCPDYCEFQRLILDCQVAINRCRAHGRRFSVHAEDESSW